MKFYLNGQFVEHLVSWPLVRVTPPQSLGSRAELVVKFCRSEAVTDAYHHVERVIIPPHPFDLAVNLPSRSRLPSSPWSLVTGDQIVDWHYERDLWGLRLRLIELNSETGGFFYVDYLDQSWTTPISTLSVAFDLATRLAAKHILSLQDEAREIIAQGGDPDLDGEPVMSRFDHILGGS